MGYRSRAAPVAAREEGGHHHVKCNEFSFNHRHDVRCCDCFDVRYSRSRGPPAWREAILPAALMSLTDRSEAMRAGWLLDTTAHISATPGGRAPMMEAAKKDAGSRAGRWSKLVNDGGLIGHDKGSSRIGRLDTQ